MARISEMEFRRIFDGIVADKESIIRHNPFGTREEVLLWMLMNSLVAYLSLSEIETPCFNGQPYAGVYRDAIEFILSGRKSEEFEVGALLDKLAQE